MATKVKFTYQDYLLTPSDKSYELIEGELLMTPAPAPSHQRIARKLFEILNAYVASNASGEIFFAPVDVYLSEETVVQPDLLYIESKRLGIVKEKNIQGAPDLVVEILSPATKDRDTEIKRKLYWKYGVREYWIVDPDARTTEIMVLKESGYETSRVFPAGTKVHSPLFKDLSFDATNLF